MLYQHTRIYSDHNSMTCSCAQCQHARNASTAILPRLAQSAPVDVRITEIFTPIDAETGARVTYYWPVQRKYYHS